MIASLQRAIVGRRISLIEYEGVRRVIEPHTVGCDAGGRLLLRAYQPDTRGNARGWQLFVLARCCRLVVTRLVFCRPRPGYARGDTAMARIIAEL